MSQPTHKKKFGSEFLCRTRYRNTLPLPPFAPKLLALPSSAERYIPFQSTGLTETTANELILDNQWAMPIDLIEMREAFFGEGRHSAETGLNGAGPGVLDKTDEMLIELPIKSQAAAKAPGHGGLVARSGLTIPSRSRLPAVSWLRRTEYISSETPTGAGKGAGKDSGARRNKMVVDNSREGQIAAIEKTFNRFLSEDDFLAGLKHPTKPDLKAVESLQVFPDFSIWGNAYTLVTFDVDPEMSNDREAQTPEQGSSKKAQRSSNALIKPMHDANDPETWLGYYLPDQETAQAINQRKRTRASLVAARIDPDDQEEGPQEYSFSLQRDYTYTTIPCNSLSQLAFTFRDQGPESNQRAAFYNPMQSKLMLRKKRAKRYEDDDPPITDIDVTTRRMNSDELGAKRDALEAIGL
ncbi:RNA polymerase II-associated factor 1 [Entomortierella parvispora]|uniref:RNA polymerase II-associated factor 1 n=1 Tax=Entomortierella parvispora TaxID=205924 RepID=A0A9P3H8W7_9FUNG|nr:RNA polymerase II-associated factor 1 [Entomortierella parvispora]